MLPFSEYIYIISFEKKNDDFIPTLFGQEIYFLEKIRKPLSAHT